MRQKVGKLNKIKLNEKIVGYLLHNDLGLLFLQKIWKRKSKEDDIGSWFYKNYLPQIVRLLTVTVL